MLSIKWWKIREYHNPVAKAVTEECQKQRPLHESIWAFFLILIWPKWTQYFKCLYKVVKWYERLLKVQFSSCVYLGIDSMTARTKVWRVAWVPMACTLLSPKWKIRGNDGEPTVKTHFRNGAFTSQDEFVWAILSSFCIPLRRKTRSVLSISWTREWSQLTNYK